LTGDPLLNFVEAVECLRTVSAFQTECAGELPKLQVYNAENEGYVIWIKNSLISEEFRNFLMQVVETRRLGIKKTEGYLIIYSV
jgi:hypothetical protein